MICPKCKELGNKSSVTVGYSMSTLMYCPLTMIRRGSYITMTVTTILLRILALEGMIYPFLASENVEVVAMGVIKRWLQ